MQLDLDFFRQDVAEIISATDNRLASFQRIYLEILERQRKLLTEINRSSEFDEEVIRKYLSLIDMEEFKTREKQLHN